MKFRNIIQVICFMLWCMLDNSAYGATVQIDVCQYINTVMRRSQNCIGILAVLNNTAGHTHDDACRLYNEVAHCIQTETNKNGELCSLPSLHETFTRMSTTFVDKWLLNLNISSCTLTDLTESICTSPDRVGLVSSVGCMKPIIGGFATSHSSGFVCATLSGLVACSDTFLKMLEDNRCNAEEIKRGLRSETANKWIQTHYPTVKLQECFDVYQPGETGSDSECTDFVYISKNTRQAMGEIFTNNVTVVGQKLYCQALYYAIHLLQHEMGKLGHTCSIQDLHKTMSKLLGYQGVSQATLSHCQGEMGKTPTEFCEDKSAVLHVLADEPYCKPYIYNIIGAPNDSHYCMYVKQFVTCAETKLHYAGFDCDNGDIFQYSKISQFMTAEHNITLPVC